MSGFFDPNAEVPSAPPADGQFYGLRDQQWTVIDGRKVVLLCFGRGGNTGPNNAPVGALGSSNTARLVAPFAGVLRKWSVSANSNNVTQLGLRVRVHDAAWNVGITADQVARDKDPGSGNVRATGEFPSIPVARGDQIEVRSNNNTNVSRYMILIELEAAP